MNPLTKCGGAVFVVALLLGLAAPAAAQEMTGTLLAVYPDTQEFVLAAQGYEMLTFQMDEDAQVLLNGLEATLADLEAGDEVTVVHRQEGALWLAIEVRCERAR